MDRQTPFREDRPDVLCAAMRDIRLAALVTPAPDGIAITHAPMLLRTLDGRITLDCHVARGNPHWEAATGAPSAAIFQGPQAYVTPSWYASKREHGKVVPTWNYIAVHAHGCLTAVHDPAWLSAHLSDLTDASETGRSAPWAVADAPETYISSLSRGIVGLRMQVDRIEGIWKVSQNRSAADQAGVISGLGPTGPSGAALVAALKQRLD